MVDYGNNSPSAVSRRVNAAGQPGWRPGDDDDDITVSEVKNELEGQISDLQEKYAALVKTVDRLTLSKEKLKNSFMNNVKRIQELEEITGRGAVITRRNPQGRPRGEQVGRRELRTSLSANSKLWASKTST